jgi:hypothetical protein
VLSLVSRVQAWNKLSLPLDFSLYLTLMKYREALAAEYLPGRSGLSSFIASVDSVLSYCHCPDILERGQILANIVGKEDQRRGIVDLLWSYDSRMGDSGEILDFLGGGGC